jgi:hypothetical protein
MAEFDRSGEDWGDDELAAIVADYFRMLAEELAKRPYTKAEHRRALMQVVRRSPGSIERKHQNISAVLVELGLPWIWGYKPLPNYQEALFQAIDRQLSGAAAALPEAGTSPQAEVDPGGVFVDMPMASPRQRRVALERLVRKFDPVARDFRNRQLGRAGEEFVVDLERRRLFGESRPDLARKVRWVAMEDGDGAGFDVMSFDAAGSERLIEVKTTNGAAQTPFFMTRNEMDVATERSEHWHLYRVHLFAQQPRIFVARPPLDRALMLSPEVWRATPTPGGAEPA